MHPRSHGMLLIALAVVLLHVAAWALFVSEIASMKDRGVAAVAALTCLFAVWAALGNRSTAERLFAFVATSWFYGMIIAYLLDPMVPSWLEFSFMYAMVGAMVALPLLVMRRLGWRISSTSSRDPGQQQFSLLRLMAAVAIAAVLFAISRQVGPSSDVSDIGYSWVLEWTSYGTVFGSTGLIAIYFALGRQRFVLRILITALLIAVIYQGTVSTAWILMAHDFFVQLISVEFIAIAGVLMLCRWLGIELRRIQPAAAEPAD